MTDEFKKPAQLRKFAQKNQEKKKLKTLRQNVLHPLLIAISAISAVMIIFFNVVILLMLYTGVISDLNSLSGTVEQFVGFNEENGGGETSVLEYYKKEVERRSISFQSNIVILNRNAVVIQSAQELADGELAAIEAGVKAAENNGDILKIKTDEDLLLLSPVKVKGENSVYIYASLRSLWNTVKWSNRALFVIIAVSVLGFVFASHIIAGNISKPIKKLSDHMEVIGDGDFSPVEIKATSAELEKLTVSINEMLARLQAYNDAHTASIQNLSHDLRTPLMSISGYAEAIKFGVIDKPEDAADVIIKESKRLTEVVEKMLILSKLDSLNQPVNMVPTELVGFLREEAKRIEGYAMQNDVEIHCVFNSENVSVMADSELLYTIVRNLLSNAVRYASSAVEICVIEDDNSVRVCISDDGNGLTKEDKKYLFVRYYVGETGHSGLGLSTAKSAAEYMGCTLTGENRSELPQEHPCFNKHGAVFTVDFPKYR